MLLRSQIRCGHCGELVASLRRHDFRYCPCGKTAIDGGRDYLRILGDLADDESIWIEEDLSLEEGGHVMAVLRAIALIAPHDKPGSAVPFSMVQGSLAANVIWPARGKRGLPQDHKRPDSQTRKLLKLLVSNGLVIERPRWRYRAAVELAEHLDLT